MNSPLTFDNEEQRIRETAYHLWENDGRPMGRAEVYWEMARTVTASQLEPPAPAAKAPRAKKGEPKVTKAARATSKKSAGVPSGDYAAI
jgi:hypothetical protein